MPRTPRSGFQPTSGLESPLSDTQTDIVIKGPGNPEATPVNTTRGCALLLRRPIACWWPPEIARWWPVGAQ